MSSSENLLDLAASLEDLALIFDQLNIAIQKDNPAQVKLLAERSHEIKLKIATKQQGLSELLPSPENANLIVRMRNATAKITDGETRLQQWTKARAASEQLDKTEDTRQLVDKLLKEPWGLDADIITLVGQGSARVARELAQRGQKRILVYLPPNAPDEDFPSQATVVRSVRELIGVVELLPGANPKRATTQRMPGATVSNEKLRAVGEAVTFCIKSKNHRQNTVDRYGESWVLQGIRNLPHLAKRPSVNAMGSRFANKPCVIIGPGPSLQKNIHLLHKLKGRVLLIAFQRTLGALAHIDLVPDIIITVDAQEWVASQTRQFPLQDVGALVLDMTVHTNNFELPTKNIFTFSGCGEMNDWLVDILGEESVRFDPGGSVACSAMELALFWKCDPIVFVGLDLSFAGEKMYIPTTYDGTLKIVSKEGGKRFEAKSGKETRFQRELTSLRGVNGGEVQTSKDMAQFHAWIQAISKEIDGKVALLNCTEGGAYIEGMTHMPLAKAMAQLSSTPIDVNGIFEGAMNQIDPKERAEKIHNRVETLSAKLKQSVSRAKKCRTLVPKVKRNPNSISKLQQAEQHLVASLKGLECLSLMRQKQIREARTIEAHSIEEQLSKSDRLFAIIEEAGKLLLTHLNDYLNSREQ